MVVVILGLCQGVLLGDCIAIEAWRDGPVAAKLSGRRCVIFNNPHPGNQDLSAADLIIDDFRKLNLKALSAV